MIWVKKKCKGLNFGMWDLFHLRNIALKFFRWVVLHFQEITYEKKGTEIGKTKCFLHMQYLENEANLSAKTMGHCLTYMYQNKTACKFGAFSTKFTFD